MTPEYPVVGNTALRVPAINSPNFNLANPAASPQPSWAILQSGLAYFFGLTITGGTINGTDYIIDTTGTYLYSGTPALNNLVYSETQGIVDPVGNTTIPGITVYQGNIATNIVASGMTVYSNSSGQTGTWSQLGTFFLTTPAATSYWYSTLGIVTAKPSYGQQPGTVPPPVVPEVWHAMSLTSGWTGTARYKVLSDNLTVMVESYGAALATNGTIANGTSIWVPPVGYVPAQGQQMISLAIGSVGAGSAPAAGSPQAIMSAAGLTVQNIATQVATTVRFSGTYALD